MSDTVIAIVSAFFVIGILVGFITVVAMSALRTERRDDSGDLLDYETREPPGLPWENTGPDRHPRWPGDADDDFGGR